jgi:hypothetical protein
MHLGTLLRPVAVDVSVERLPQAIEAGAHRAKVEAWVQDGALRVEA